jgi:hypothetical protein
MQEKRFKRRIAHGARNVHDGITKMLGPDRHQMRAREEVNQALLAAHEQGEKQERAVKESHAKVAESKEKGHTKRLHQRARCCGVQEEEWHKAFEKHQTLGEQERALGEPRTRADRDLRKQRIMTWRTLLLEHVLMAFVMALWGKLEEKVSLESLGALLFERSGSRIERGSESLYVVNTAGVS